MTFSNKQTPGGSRAHESDLESSEIFRIFSSNLNTAQINDQAFSWDNFDSVNPYDREPLAVSRRDQQLVAEDIDSILRATCGGKLHLEGGWGVGDLIVSSFGTLGGSEPGWLRWRLPSFDGAIRLRDKGAPSVILSPTCAIFSRKCDYKASGLRRVTLCELRDQCKKHAKAVEVVDVPLF